MISKAKLKYIKSLQVKKYRNEEQCFLVEGEKSIKEILHSSFEVVMIAGVPDFLSTLGSSNGVECIECTEKELASIGTFQTNEAAIAVARMKPNRLPSFKEDELILGLDDIRDPGNLGTIIRVADWYGISNIIASENTTDCYNPKVVNSSMGSFTRVNVYYTQLASFINVSPRTVYGAFLDGDDIHHAPVERGALVVVGNESRGISEELQPAIHHRITIPKYGSAESLNAGIATAIILDNILRSQK